MNGLLTLTDLTTEKMLDLIDLALEMKKGLKISYPDKKMATLFFENSTRTHYSFISAMHQLDIKVVDVNTACSSIQKGETLYDTVRTLEALGMDGVVIRHPQDQYFKALEKIKIPIFNGGDGKSHHPTQSLLDLMTIYEEFGHFEGLRCYIIGDIAHSRVAHTNIEVMKRLNMEVFISGPKEFDDGCAPFIPFEEALLTSDVVMLLRIQFERHEKKMNLSKEEYHQAFGLTEQNVSKMKDNAIILHPAPVNRGIEIADAVVECAKSRIYRQMENGVWIRMAVLSRGLEGKL
ncbi:MAG TPA: aspartate carbamoyltransferase catalytic subunit [Candidatus Pelethenecus faecipullorum]|uniref:Aspartate carbamoyltransferase n=1 Tax=Candidatus Pelethenecus faecipullorum TaxID=2840900 RepID=A0A9D1GR07_9MOLU|nr:aspartate carbamoyltransferase catalytic subunit [Candidatus Pelethenecus faecipullorum]